jgi:hypothetical protein
METVASSETPAPIAVPTRGHISEENSNPLTSELNLSAQRCLTRIFNGDFAS